MKENNKQELSYFRLKLRSYMSEHHPERLHDTEFITTWKSHTNLTHPGKYFRPSKVKIMRPTSPK